MGEEIFLSSTSDTVEIAYCNRDPDLIFGHVYNGGGNINVSPMYEDPELLTLPVLSLCINAGTKEYTCRYGTVNPCPVVDILGISRPQDGYVGTGACEVIPTGISMPTGHTMAK